MPVMGVRQLASGKGRVLALLVSVALSAAVIYVQNGEHPARIDALAAAPASAAAPPAAAAPLPGPAPAAQADLLAASAPIAAQDYQLALAKGIAPEQGLQVKTIWVARAISTLYPQITTIGGYRQDALKWHPNGLAIDVMIPNYHSQEGIELGNEIAGLALANAKRWGVLHVIWRQGFYPGIGAPSWTADYGNETANHYDHVHIATDGGGYPTGKETYYLGSMSSGS